MLTIPTHVVPGDLQGKLRAVAEAGFEGIDLHPTDVAQFGGSMAELAALIGQASLHVSAFGPVGADASPKVIAAKAEVARALGTDLLIVEVSEDLPKLDDFDIGLRVALRPGRAAEKVVLQAIADANNPMIGLAMNSFAALGDGSRPARLRDLPFDRLFHVSLWDGPGQPMLPGQGQLNLGGFARVLARGGYAGPWSVGVAPDGANTVLNAYRSLVTVLDDAAQTEPALRGVTPALPAKVPAKGIEFIEFAVGGPDAATLEATLSAMAFRCERKHLTKRVTLWRQGAVNIVINQEEGGHAGQARVQHGPCVCDMGLRVQDAAETVARARALGTPGFTQDVGLGELTIPAIRGVGGSVVHFIDERSDLHRVWDIEFEPVQIARKMPPAGLRRIDHVAQTMRYEEMQSWLLYYLSTFDMRKSAIVNVADPSGIVRSQAIETPEGEVRLNLNGASEGETLAGSFVTGRPGAGVQHIALQTDDIFETSAALQMAGFPRLAIPQNYYTDTQAAFDLSDDFIGRLSAANMLYDADEHGSYLQLYGQAIFEGFFFEIVERKGRYSGYGARNAPIRLAAQAQARTMKGAA